MIFASNITKCNAWRVSNEIHYEFDNPTQIDVVAMAIKRVFTFQNETWDARSAKWIMIELFPTEIILLLKFQYKKLSFENNENSINVWKYMKMKINLKRNEHNLPDIPTYKKNGNKSYDVMSARWNGIWENDKSWIMFALAGYMKTQDEHRARGRHAEDDSNIYGVGKKFTRISASW